MDKNVKTALIIGGIIVAILVVLPVVMGLFWGGRYGGWGMMGPWGMGGFSTMFIMPILGIVVLGLIIWAVLTAVRRPGEWDSATRTPDSALEVLKKRYARGEISKEEFEEKKKDLV